MPYHIANSLATLNRGLPRLLAILAMAQACVAGESGASGVLEVPHARSAFAPSAAFFNGRIYLGWRGAGTPDAREDDQQLYLASYGGGAWSQPQVLNAKSMFGPVMAASSEHLFLAWHGPGNLFSGTGDLQLYFAYVQRDGEIRYLGAIPGALSAGPPGLAVFDGLVYVGWRSTGNITLGLVPGNRHWINYGVFDPISGAWQEAPSDGINIVHANSNSGPSFAPVGEKMYALWGGTGSVTFFGPNSDPGDPNIYFGSFDGQDWSTLHLPLPTIPGALTSWSPWAVAWKGVLFVGWRGDQRRGVLNDDPALSFALLEKNLEWKFVEPFGDRKPGSAFAPSMVVDPAEDCLWIFWRGVLDRVSQTDDQQIYSTTIDDVVSVR